MSLHTTIFYSHTQTQDEQRGEQLLSFLTGTTKFIIWQWGAVYKIFQEKAEFFSARMAMNVVLYRVRLSILFVRIEIFICGRV